MAAKRAQVATLDGPGRARLIRLAGGVQGDVERALVFALALANWDQARRLSGMPELCVVRAAARRSAPLPDLKAVLGVYQSDRPRLGVGEGAAFKTGVALDASRTWARGGHPRRTPDGFVWEPGEAHVKQSASGPAQAKGVHRLDLWLDVQAAVRWFEDDPAFVWLMANVWGEWEPVARKERVGALVVELQGGGMAPVRQIARVRRTCEEIAKRCHTSAKTVRESVRRVRRALERRLVECGLIPEPQRPRRAKRKPEDPIALVMGG